MHFQLASLNLSEAAPDPDADGALAPETLFAMGDSALAKVLHRGPFHSSSTIQNAAYASFLETPTGIAVLVLARRLSSSRPSIAKNWPLCKKYLENTVKVACSVEGEIDDDGCEVLYGRAGLLYGLLYLKKALYDFSSSSIFSSSQEDFISEYYDSLKGLVSDETLQQIVESIIIRGKHGSRIYSQEFRNHKTPPLPPLMWIWHGKRYLGGAHGVGV